jgi:hypothetical protein
MTDLAGFGTPGWLPERVRMAQAREDAAEAREARRADDELATRREAAHEQALELFRAGAEARGEHVDAFALASGHVRGRPLADILAGAASAADKQDEAEAWRQERGEAEPLHVFVGDPVLHHPPAKSERAVVMRRLYRRFTESREANRAAAEKRRALDAELIPLRATVQLNRPRPDPAAAPWEQTRRGAGDGGIRYR